MQYNGARVNEISRGFFEAVLHCKMGRDCMEESELFLYLISSYLWFSLTSNLYTYICIDHGRMGSEEANSNASKYTDLKGRLNCQNPL